MPVKVFIVSTASVGGRDMLAHTLRKAPDLEILGCAGDLSFAIGKIRELKPEVILADIDNPRHDNVGLLKRLASAHNAPIVAYAAIPEFENARSVELLAAGAQVVLAKAASTTQMQRAAKEEQLVRKLRFAGQSRPGRPSGGTNPTTSAMLERQNSPKLGADAILPLPNTGTALNQSRTTERVIVIGVSTGGTQALEYLLPRLPRDCLGMAIVQHMPENFTAAFAQRLNDLSKIEVREAKNGDRIQKGQALIAPGNRHLLVKRNNLQQYVAEVREGPLINRHRPSVDVLFRSAAVYVGVNAFGFILTGMGDDGATGLKEMRSNGAHTVAQDEASCVVFGMPKEAIRRGGAMEILSLDAIAHKISSLR